MNGTSVARMILVGLVLAASTARAAVPEKAPVDEGKDRGLLSEARELRVPFAPDTEAALLEAESDTDVTHYFLDLEIIPEYPPQSPSYLPWYRKSHRAGACGRPATRVCARCPGAATGGLPHPRAAVMTSVRSPAA